MASFENVSFIDQSASVIMLNIKPNQNLIVDLDESHYNALIKHLIECLRFSPLMKVMTMHEDVSLMHLSKAYSTAIYNKTEEIINFEVSSHKTSITKSNFCKLLGLVSCDVGVDPESIPATSLIDMFFQMGIQVRFPYCQSSEVLLASYQSLSVRVSSSDSASNFFSR